MNDSDPGPGITTETQEAQSSTSSEEEASTPSKSVAAAGVQIPASPDGPTANSNQKTDAIHKAFMMGWSLQELKSDVLLKALGLPQSVSTIDPSAKTGSTDGSSAKETPRSLSGMVDMLLQRVLASASNVASQMMGLSSDLNGSLARTSEWRANFIRIATVHDQCFPGSTTENTPYDPSPELSPESRFPFLYPTTSPDYALIGINNSSSVGVGNFDDDEHLGKFKLYDVTRRALNCLALLYTKPVESLLPDLVSDFQTLIVKPFSMQTQASETGNQKSTSEEAGNQEDSNGGATGNQESTNEEATTILAVFQAYINESAAGPSSNTLNEAIKSLSFLIVRFLDSWDGYLRENFYAGGQLENNELELLAYESGYSLSSLSSTVSLMAMPLENTSVSDSAALQQLSSHWQKVFTSSNINSVQRQISALGTALDDEYYILKNGPRPVAGELPDPDLPGNIIHAITYSLDYWRRGVDWICPQTTEPATPPAVETAKPPILTAQFSRQMSQCLITQAGIWQTLMLGQQTLRSFTAESVTKRILNNFMSEFEIWVKKELEQPYKNEMQRIRTPMIVLGILALVIIGGGIVLLALTGQLQSLAAVIALFVGSALTLVSSVLTRANSVFSPASNESSAPSSTPANNANLEQRLGSLFGQAGESIVTVFQDAYKQILIEFDYLNHNVAISYPLIELFVNSPDISKDIKDGYYFLTEVVWTSEERKEELDRVARAAFGPLGALISPPTSTSQSPPINQGNA